MSARTTFYAYRLLSRVAEVLPASSVIPVSKFVGRVAARALPKRRHLIEKHLTKVTGSSPSRHLVNATFASYARFWIQSLRLPVVPRAQLDDVYRIEGVEHIESALAAGKGAILALPHVGNWDVAGAWLVNHVTPLTVVVEQVDPPQLFVWFKEFRESLGLNVVVNDADVTKTLLGVLKSNQAIALLSDRDVDGTGADFEFFGEVTKIPRGAALLALRSGAALLPAATYDSGKGHRTVVGPALPVAREGKLSDDVTRITEDLLREFEKFIRNAPEQWHLFQPHWPSDRD